MNFDLKTLGSCVFVYKGSNSSVGRPAFIFIPSEDHMKASPYKLNALFVVIENNEVKLFFSLT